MKRLLYLVGNPKLWGLLGASVMLGNYWKGGEAVNDVMPVLWYNHTHYKEVAMPQAPLKEKRKRETRQAPPLEFPEQIDASPEEIARAIINTPPKKTSEWDFMKRRAEELARR